MDTENTLHLTEGHPVQTYLKESSVLHKLLQELQETKAHADFQKFYNLFNQLQTIENRFVRKENQLFPFLEKRGWHGPSQGMWSFHDTLREEMRIIRKAFDAKQYQQVDKDIAHLINGILNLMKIEETILFPKALSILQEEDWIAISKGEKETGWMLASPPPVYLGEKNEKEIKSSLEAEPVFEKNTHYDEGYLSIEQVNLLFKTLPIDLTFVDENDRVIFYNRGQERVFPRSAGIIGREVKFCHPPKSVGTVLEILEKFRTGQQNEASFWINYKGRLIYIRYFAVRDAEKKYRGVIEMSQDISDLKNIEGERRLLHWQGM
ncbi:MAG: DUF438 domain-containing protein [Bacteroidetes bacterium]|nr:DUF438 domain-containing protein [Bacteroidota bacterium]